MDAQHKIVIDPELRDLIPPLDEAERAKLAESIKKDGCLDSLKVWQDGQRQVLLDGHNRKAICDDLGVPFKVDVVDSITNRYEAVTWMIDLQMSRRNLTPICLSYLRGRRYLEEKKAAHCPQKGGQNVHLSEGKTAGRLGQTYGVCGKTIRRDATFAKAVDMMKPEHRTAFLAGRSPYRKKDVIADYMVKTGKHADYTCKREKIWRVEVRKAIEAINGEIVGHGHDIRMEILGTVVGYLFSCAHFELGHLDRAWRTAKKEVNHG